MLGRRRSKSEKQGQRLGGGTGEKPHCMAKTSVLWQKCRARSATTAGIFKNGLKYMEVPPKMNMIQNSTAGCYPKKLKSVFQRGI